MKRVLLTITGKVQGVGFRRYAMQRARALGLTGYVCNLDDGSVELLVQGAYPAVDQLIAECEIGPPYADVRDVLVEEDDRDEIYLDFSVTG
ncbi:acylphosphatase [Shewanella sp.]|uniref:acylphosphatase n=1 Tax=Shewanella sp. TaxID=50422 RepID=UPI003A971DC2